MELRTSAQELPLSLRPVVPSDMGFVASTWLKSYKGAKGTRDMAWRTYRTFYRDLIGRLIDRDDTMLLVATPAFDDHHICGWICFAHAGRVPVVHYLATRPAYRRMGIARMMAEKAGVVDECVYTFNAYAARWLAPKVERAVHIPIEEWIG